MVVILNEVKNLMNSSESSIEILRLSPQNDIATQALRGRAGVGVGETRDRIESKMKSNVYTEGIPIVSN